MLIARPIVFFSDNWPIKARHWLPTIDHPSDKATTEMFVTAPSHYQVVSNGLLVEVAIQVEGEPATRVGSIELRDKKATLTIPCDRPPKSVVLDPRTHVLMDADVAPSPVRR